MSEQISSDTIKNRSNDTLNDIVVNEYDQEEKVAKNIVSQAVREARNEFMKQQQLTSTLNENYDHLTSNSRTAINDLDEIVKVEEKHSVASQFRLNNTTVEMDNSETINKTNHTYTQLDEIKFYKLNKKGYDLMLDRLNSIFILLIIPIFLALSKRTNLFIQNYFKTFYLLFVTKHLISIFFLLRCDSKN